MLNTIRENAKWFVAVPIVCFGALIFVDWGMNPGNGMTQKNTVGEVDGEKLSFEAFNQEVEAQAKQATGEGRELEALQYAEIRANVFETFVRLKLSQADFEKYSLSGSPIEVLEHLKNNPPPGAEKAPIFMGPDSQFSRPKYLQWLATPKVFDDPYMQAMEAQLTTTTIPERQISHLLAAAQPISDLEIRFRAKLDRSKLWATFLMVTTDSFMVDPSTVTDAEMKKWFESHPDTLWHSKSAAIAPYVTLSKAASKADSAYAKAQADSVYAMATAGQNFEELARNYSEDPGSAKQGGDLGGFQSLKRWVPEFGTAARSLDSGKISTPIQSPFGWHVILSKGRKIENADTLYALSHVLIGVQTSPETIDSLKLVAENLRKLVKAGSTFGEAASKFGLKIDTTEALTEGTKSSLASGFVPGINAYLFNSDEGVSEVLENRTAVHVVGRGKVFEPGRHFELDKKALRDIVVAEKAVAGAKAWIEGLRTKAIACDTAKACLNGLGRVYTQVFEGRPLSTFIEGFGYSSPELVRLWKTAKAKEWTAVVGGKTTAGMMRMDSSRTVTQADEDKMVADARPLALRLRSRGVTQNWYAWRKSLAKVENHLDRYFRD
ncbi:MAG: hypothetical protein RL318_70 [Fibrobacterota bacterium]|jgi:parvulin-like peptidyl-prolyl isomerase